MSPGTKIGRYQIERELGHGGMGTVFLAEDPVIGRRVALKLIRLDDSASAEQQHMLAQGFLKETRLAGVLHHPGVVGVFDAGRQDNLAYIVMEFIDGPTVDAMLRSKPRPELAQLLDICRQAAGILDYAHARGVIHRDVKPTNLLVQHDGAVKICDFGIAKVMQSTEFTLTQAGMAVGTPEFMSPEQVLGQPLDGRSDQWSLAVVAYEMVAGVRPFRADSYTQVMARIMTLDPEPARQHNPALPNDVDVVFARVFSKKPQDRFPNCWDFAEALQKACLGSLAPAPVASAPVYATPAVPTPAVLTPAAATPAIPTPFVPTPAVPTPRVPTSAVATPAVPTMAAEMQTPGVEPSRKAGPPMKLIAALAIVLIVAGGAAAWLWFHHSTAAPAPAETVQSPVFPSPPPAHRTSAARKPSPAADLATPAANHPAAGQPAAKGTQALDTYSVRLATVPDGATVTVDQNTDAACQSPCRAELPSGKHTIVAKKEGYYQIVKDFDVDGQEGVTLTLVQITGTVWIDSNPAGASITVNGTPRTEITPVNLVLPVGQYKVRWTKEGFEPYEFELTVSAGLTQIKPTLAKSSH
jgi:serine/threonine-protein kinase